MHAWLRGFFFVESNSKHSPHMRPSRNRTRVTEVKGPCADHHTTNNTTPAITQQARSMQRRISSRESTSELLRHLTMLWKTQITCLLICSAWHPRLTWLSLLSCYKHEFIHLDFVFSVLEFKMNECSQDGDDCWATKWNTHNGGYRQKAVWIDK